MKVKIFASRNTENLEKQVNDFLQTVSNVIDIKYAANQWSEVLVIYDETKAAE